MFDNELLLGIRNLLLVHLMIAASIPEQTARLQYGVLRMWKTLTTRPVSKRSNSRTKKFWEIDMTKFEP
jgi:hypothetical protein